MNAQESVCKRAEDESDGGRITPGDVCQAHLGRCRVEYHLARARGLADPLILVDAPDPEDLDDVAVESRARLAVALAGCVDGVDAEVLLTTPADRLIVLVLFGDEVHGYTMDRPPAEPRRFGPSTRPAAPPPCPAFETTTPRRDRGA
jgi:hypothetical protein